MNLARVTPDTVSRQLLRSRLREARQRCDELFSLLHPDSLYERPIPERNRIIFYLGHFEAFEWNLICEGLFGMKSARPEFDRLFAFGIDPTNGNLPQDLPGDWPGETEIRDYNTRVRQAVDFCLERATEEQRFHVAIEHRLMHVETLTYMLHQLPFEQKRVPGAASARPDLRSAVRHEMVQVPAGRTELGMTAERGVFGWDNEFGEQQVDVPAFEIDRFMVTNGAFLAFIEDGGYRMRELWNDADWTWKESAQVEHPVFWLRGPEGWQLRTMFEDIALPLAWPVYVSHAEASAFARWRGAKLPGEAQWQRAAHGALPGHTDNFDFRDWNPVAVDATPDSASTWGVEGLYGNGWEWTSTLFGPLPGFKAFPFYEGYSANFFDGQHYAMKGGSPRTAQCMLRPTFRNWFRARYPYVYATFRCVR